MPRRRGPSDTTAVRRRILAAAAPIFEAKGFDGASTRQLAAAAGLNISTLAYHFGNKEGLYLAVLDTCCAELLAFPVPPELPEAPVDAVRAVMLRVYGFAQEHRGAVKILTRHELEHGALPARVGERWAERTFERLAALQAALPGVPLLGRRIELRTLRHLVARYAVSDGDEVIGQHLGDVAVKLLVD